MEHVENINKYYVVAVRLQAGGSAYLTLIACSTSQVRPSQGSCRVHTPLKAVNTREISQCKLTAYINKQLNKTQRGKHFASASTKPPAQTPHLQVQDQSIQNTLI